MRFFTLQIYTPINVPYADLRVSLRTMSVPILTHIDTLIFAAKVKNSFILFVR